MEVFTFGNKQFGISISLGLAEYGRGLAMLEMLIAQADKALCMAKDEGRNRAVCTGIAGYGIFAIAMENTP